MFGKSEYGPAYFHILNRLIDTHQESAVFRAPPKVKKAVFPKGHRAKTCIPFSEGKRSLCCYLWIKDLPILLEEYDLIFCNQNKKQLFCCKIWTPFEFQVKH